MSHTSLHSLTRGGSARRPTGLLLYMALVSLLGGTGCAARNALAPELAPLAFTADGAPEAAAAPPVLTENHFRRDNAGSISEEALREVLASPVFLEEKARVGIVPVQGSYALDMDVPLPAVTAALAEALDGSGEFELASEVSTDFPVDRGISGLRELAARYRCDYLLIYRHRFVDDAYLNPVAWGYLTVLGALFLPGHTLESAGVLEATLFDVKTGTLLFTVNERVHDRQSVNMWHPNLKTRAMKRQLLEAATQKLADQVVGKVRRLVAARPAAEPRRSKAVVSSAPVPAEAAGIPVTVSTTGL